MDKKRVDNIKYVFLGKTFYKKFPLFILISAILLFFVLNTQISLAANTDCYCGTDGLGYCYTNCHSSDTEIDGWSCTWDTGQLDYWCCYPVQDDTYGQENCWGYCDPGCTPETIVDWDINNWCLWDTTVQKQCTDDCDDVFTDIAIALANVHREVVQQEHQQQITTN